jgi:cysteine desulfurase
LIYLDYAAASPLAPGVWDAMTPWFTEQYGNPGSLHEAGDIARDAITQARRTLAEFLQCQAHELLFTSGGTESNNLILQGVFRALKQGRAPSKPVVIITSAGEHSAVLEPVRYLKQHEGALLCELPLTVNGTVCPAAYTEALQTFAQHPILVSLLHVNNETGAMNPIARLAKQAKEAGAFFHTDAVQSFGKLSLHMATDYAHVDYLSTTAHKCGGPRGVGLCFVRSGAVVPLPLILGGGQEQGLRGGTLNTAGIVGFAAAVSYAANYHETRHARISHLHRLALEHMAHLEQQGTLRLNSPQTGGLPGIINVSIPGKSGDALVLHLDMQGVCASSGSACHAEALSPSHVVLAQTHDVTRASQTLRLSFGPETEEAELRQALAHITALVKPVT